MPKFLISKSFCFEMAHRIVGASGTGPLHGHSYRADIIIETNALDKNGMVMDFGVLENAVRKQFEILDGHCLVTEDDALPQEAFGCDIIRVPYNPTAENLARDLGARIGRILYEAVPSLAKIAVRIHCSGSEWAEFQATICELEDIFNDSI